MEVLIRPDAEGVAGEAFEAVTTALGWKRDLTIGLATGRTPLLLYRRMRESGVDFSEARFFNLDELVGLAPDDPASFARYLYTNLLSGINVRPDRVRLLRGDVPDLPAECEAYEAAIRACGGIDLQILGVGRNGHIAFNEPGSSLGSRTRVKTLEARSVEDYQGWMGPGRAVPRFSVTMGVATILEARRIVLMATGVEKASIVQRMIEGPVSAEVPGSALQFHPRVTVVVDEAAASALTRRDYWRWAEANRWRANP